MAAQKSAILRRQKKRIGWLPHQGLIKALMVYKIMKKFLVRLSKVKLLELWSVCGFASASSPTMHFDCPLHPPNKCFGYFTASSHAGVFAGARISALPTKGGTKYELPIGDKIVETLFLNRVTSENKRIRTPPLSPPFKVGVCVVFYR